MRALRLGDWEPSKHNLALAVIQVVSAGQAGLRGVDYLQDRRPGPVSPSVRAVEEISNLHGWGALFLLGAGILIVCLAGGWVTGVFVGHAVLCVAYLVLGGILLSGVVETDLLAAVAGSALLCAGLWLAMDRWFRWDTARFAAALLLIFGGGLWASSGLGVDFRSATGVISAGILQMAVLLGTAVFVYRDRQAGELTQAPR